MKPGMANEAREDEHGRGAGAPATVAAWREPGSSMDSQLEPGKVDARRKVRFALLVSGFSDLNKMDTAIAPQY